MLDGVAKEIEAERGKVVEGEVCSLGRSGEGVIKPWSGAATTSDAARYWYELQL